MWCHESNVMLDACLLAARQASIAANQRCLDSLDLIVFDKDAKLEFEVGLAPRTRNHVRIVHSNTSKEVTAHVCLALKQCQA